MTEARLAKAAERACRAGRSLLVALGGGLPRPALVIAAHPAVAGRGRCASGAYLAAAGSLSTPATQSLARLAVLRRDARRTSSSQPDAASSLGFVIGAGLALPLGLLMGAGPARLRAASTRCVQVLRPIPPIAYIPLAILWFGLGNPPAVFLIAIGAFFPVLMNTIAGVRHVDAIYLRAARNLGAGRVTIFRRVILPAAMPYILTGVRIGIGTAFIVVIVAEMIAVNDGLGYRILEAREYFWSDKIIAGMITIGLRRPRHRHRHEPPQQPPAALASRAGELRRMRA